MELEYALIVPYAAALLAHLAGLVVAIILLIRVKGTPAILALVGFALLALFDIAQIILGLPFVTESITSDTDIWMWFLKCCCSIFDVAAVACLIVAIWQAVSATGGEMAEEVAEISEEVIEEVTEISEAVVEEIEEPSEEVAETSSEEPAEESE